MALDSVLRYGPYRSPMCRATAIVALVVLLMATVGCSRRVASGGSEGAVDA